MQPITVGLDLAKSVFQVHGVDAEGQVVVRRKLRRREVIPFFEKLDPCLIGMEACATAHFWTRDLSKLGHDVRMMPPSYVKAYLRRQKNDAADAEAICEAVQRPTMRFVPLKSAERQSVLTLHKARELLAWHRQDELSQRLATIPGVGVIGATALSASIPSPTMFRSGREFAAFLGLVPRQNSSGGKDRLGRISKMGDGYLRKLLVVGATSVVRRAKTDALAAAPWVRSLLERRPARVVTVAMANRTARIAWAVMARGEVYRPIAA